MKQQLDTILQKLKSDPYFAVTITNAESFKPVVSNKFGAQMASESGSVEDFFNALVDNGNNEIAIQPRRKNGSSFKDDGQPVKLSLRQKSASQALEATPIPSPTLNPSGHTHNPFMGLMAGLNAHEAIYRHQDYPRLLNEYEKVRLENETLKEKVANLKEEILKKDFSESKASGNKELITGLLSALPEVMSAMSTMKGAPVAGLAAAAPEGLSPVKQELITAINGQSDSIAQYMGVVLRGICTNQEFGNELINLLKTNNLIPSE